MDRLNEPVDISKDLQITMPLDFWWKHETFGDFMENRFTMSWEIFPLLIQQLNFSECERKEFTVSYWTVGTKQYFTFSVPIPVPENFHGHLNTGSTQQRTGSTRQSTGSTHQQHVMEDEGDEERDGDDDIGMQEIGDGLQGMGFDVDGMPIMNDDELDDELEDLKQKIIDVANNYIHQCAKFKKKFSVGSAILYYDYYCRGSVIEQDREDPHEYDALSQTPSDECPNATPNKFLEVFSHLNTQRLFQRSIEEQNSNVEINPKLEGQWTAPLTYMCQKALFVYRFPFMEFELFDKEAVSFLNNDILPKYGMRIGSVDDQGPFSEHGMNFKKFDDTMEIIGRPVRPTPTGGARNTSRIQNDDYREELLTFMKINSSRALLFANRYSGRIELEKNKGKSSYKRVKLSNFSANKFKMIEWLLLNSEDQTVKSPIILLKKMMEKYSAEIDELEKELSQHIIDNFEDYIPARNAYLELRNRVMTELFDTHRRKEENNELVYIKTMKSVYRVAEVSELSRIDYYINDVRLTDRIKRSSKTVNKYRVLSKEYYVELKKLEADDVYKELDRKIKDIERHKDDVWESWKEYRLVRDMMEYSIKSVLEDSETRFSQEYLTIPESAMLANQDLHGHALTHYDCGALATISNRNNVISLFGLAGTMENFILTEYQLTTVFDLQNEGVFNAYLVGPHGKGKSYTIEYAKKTFLSDLIKAHTTSASAKADFTTFNRMNFQIDYFTEAPPFMTMREIGGNANVYTDALAKMKAKYSSSDPRLEYTKYQSIENVSRNINMPQSARNMQVTVSHYNRTGGSFCANEDLPTSNPMRDRMEVDACIPTCDIQGLVITKGLHFSLNPVHKIAKDLFVNTVRLRNQVLVNYLLYASCVYGKKYVGDDFTSILCYNFMKNWKKSFECSQTQGARAIGRLCSLVRASMFDRIFHELFMFDKSKYRYCPVNKKIMMFEPILTRSDDEDEEEEIEGENEEVVERDGMVKIVRKDFDEKTLHRDILIRSYTTIQDVQTAISYSNGSRLNIIDGKVCELLLRMLKTGTRRFTQTNSAVKTYYTNVLKNEQTLSYKYCGNEDGWVHKDPNYIYINTNETNLGKLAIYLKKEMENLDIDVTYSQVRTSLINLQSIKRESSFRYKKIKCKGNEVLWFGEQSSSEENQSRYNGGSSSRSNDGGGSDVSTEPIATKGPIINISTNQRGKMYICVSIHGISDLRKRRDIDIDSLCTEVFFNSLGAEQAKKNRVWFFTRNSPEAKLVYGNESINERNRLIDQGFEMVNSYVDGKTNWENFVKDKDAGTELMMPYHLKYFGKLKKKTFIVTDRLNDVSRICHFEHIKASDKAKNQVFIERERLFKNWNKITKSQFEQEENEMEDE